MSSGDEPQGPDLWAVLNDVLQVDLAFRERRRHALAALSADAFSVIVALHSREGGRAFEDQLWALLPAYVDMRAGLDELLEAGLLDVAWSVDEDGALAEGILSLRYQAEVSEPEE